MNRQDDTMRLILVDAGNTTCTMAVAEGRDLHRIGSVCTREASPQTVAECLAKGKGRKPFDGAVLCSVVPSLNARWLNALQTVSRTRPIRVACTMDFGMPIRYPKPETIGPDRLVNAAAAKVRYGSPVVALDFGSALTCDVVDADGAFRGGIIAPGLRLLLDYLHERTDLLPSVSFRPVRRMVGRSTEESMRIGAWAGYRGLVRELIAGLKRELGRGTRFCATGGDADHMKSLLGRACPVIPDLTFEGMRLVYMRNRTNGLRN